MNSKTTNPMVLDRTSLAERMKNLRSKTDYRLTKKSYVMVMLDGKNFSTKVKRRFKRPFDADFIRIMNETAIYVCSKTQGAKFAYVQSDEISIVFTDFERPESACFYDNRLNKILPLLAADASAYFNQAIRELVINELPATATKDEVLKALQNEELYTFDCKAWNLFESNDVYAWFLFRQNDCIKNSKSQTAQTYISHNTLAKKTSDEQIALLLKEKGIDWHSDEFFNDGERYGRFIYKETVFVEGEYMGKKDTGERHPWISHYAFKLNSEEGRKRFFGLQIKVKDVVQPIVPLIEQNTATLTDNNVELDDLNVLRSLLSKISDSNNEIISTMNIVSDLTEWRCPNDCGTEDWLDSNYSQYTIHQNSLNDIISSLNILIKDKTQEQKILQK